MKSWLESIVEKVVSKNLTNIILDSYIKKESDRISFDKKNNLEIEETDLLCFPIYISKNQGDRYEQIKQKLIEITKHNNIFILPTQDDTKFYYPFILKKIKSDNWHKSEIKPTHESQILFAYDDSYGYTYQAGYYDKLENKYYGMQDVEAHPDFWSEINYLEHDKKQ